MNLSGGQSGIRPLGDVENQKTSYSCIDMIDMYWYMNVEVIIICYCNLNIVIFTFFQAVQIQKRDFTMFESLMLVNHSKKWRWFLGAKGIFPTQGPINLKKKTTRTKLGLYRPAENTPNCRNKNGHASLYYTGTRYLDLLFRWLLTFYQWDSSPSLPTIWVRLGLLGHSNSVRIFQMQIRDFEIFQPILLGGSSQLDPVVRII